ncbi:uncharacterized protein LOC143193748 [Rhynchophorus ferrugineus]|uniref:Iron-binding zinc finger CDGSH type domain-containing protein n=1 Tax=Rhynchophorus ferrugineus TaxID=354439 RepID=A0A834HVQ0_RHYFE|nr:hypothetical protein GWI33_018767 [Rhynchophorus ferrugineus]
MPVTISHLFRYRPMYKRSLFLRPYSSKESSDFPKNKLDQVISADKQTENGIVYEKRPFRITLEAGKKYSWCLCGRSHKQPFCDGTHKMQQLNIVQKPVRFVVEETKDYWLCNCKQTSSRPFCDGTHKSPEVQDGPSLIR